MFAYHCICHSDPSFLMAAMCIFPYNHVPIPYRVAIEYN